MERYYKELEHVRAIIKSCLDDTENLLSAAAPPDKGKCLVTSAECDFGQWYYQSGRVFKDFPAFKRLEAPHDNYHSLSLRVAGLLFQEPDLSMLDKVRGKGKFLKEKRREEAVELSSHFQALSQQLLDLVDLLEKQVKANNIPITEQLEVLSPKKYLPSKKSGKFDEMNNMLKSLDLKLDGWKKD